MASASSSSRHVCTGEKEAKRIMERNRRAMAYIRKNVIPLPDYFDITGRYVSVSNTARKARVLKGKYLVVDTDGQNVIFHHNVLFTEDSFKNNPDRVFDTILYVAGPQKAVDLMWKMVNPVRVEEEGFDYEDDYIASKQFTVEDLQERPDEMDIFITASYLAHQNMESVAKKSKHEKNQAVFDFLDRRESTHFQPDCL